MDYKDTRDTSDTIDTNESIFRLYESVTGSDRKNSQILPDPPPGYHHETIYATRFEVSRTDVGVGTHDAHGRWIENRKDLISVFRIVVTDAGIPTEKETGYMWTMAGNGERLAESLSAKYSGKWIVVVRRDGSRRMKSSPIVVVEPQPPPPGPPADPSPPNEPDERSPYVQMTLGI